VEQPCYRWRKNHGGLKADQARRLKELEQENAKLKRLVSELSLEKLVLKDIASPHRGLTVRNAVCIRPR
jgi:putative transposase